MTPLHQNVIDATQETIVTTVITLYDNDELRVMGTTYRNENITNVLKRLGMFKHNIEYWLKEYDV